MSSVPGQSSQPSTRTGRITCDEAPNRRSKVIKMQHCARRAGPLTSRRWFCVVLSDLCHIKPHMAVINPKTNCHLTPLVAESRRLKGIASFDLQGEFIVKKIQGLFLVGCSAIALAGCGPSDIASPGTSAGAGRAPGAGRWRDRCRWRGRP